jgi:hypothetical protein
MALFATIAMLRRRQSVVVPHFAVLGALGIVAPQEWLVKVMGHVEACPLPSNVRGLTSVLSFYVHGSKGGAGLRGIHALA